MRRRTKEDRALTTAVRSVRRPPAGAPSSQPSGPALAELVVRLDGDGGEALATAVRLIPHTPWLTVLDAHVDRGQVVVVLPATDRSLGEALRAGLNRDVAQVLLWTFDETLDLMDDQGLAPATLDPDALGITPSGDVLLLPAIGPASAQLERDARQLLAWLRAADGAPGVDRGPQPVHEDRPAGAGPLGDEPPPRPGPTATDERAHDGEHDGLTAGALPATHEVLTRPPRRAVESTQRRSPAQGWGRTVLLSLAAALAVLSSGVALSQLNPPEQREPAASAPDLTGAATAPTGPGTLEELVQDLEADPARAGARGRVLLAQLRQVQAGEGPRRAAAALAALETVAAAPPDDAGTARRIVAVVRPLAQPGDLASLVDLLDADPDSHGQAGPEVVSRLVDLRALPPSELARTKAQDLAAFVAARARLGQLTPAAADIVGDVLRPLAQPEDLPSLIGAVRVQPERFGPGTPAMVGRLESLVRLGGAAAQREAKALLAAIDAQVRAGAITKAFQDIAVPVLRPIASGTPTGGTT